MRMAFPIRGDSILYISAAVSTSCFYLVSQLLSLVLVLDKYTQFTQLYLVSSCQISNRTFTGTAHPGNSKLIIHA